MKLCKDCQHFTLNPEWTTQIYQEKYATCALTARVTVFDGDRCYDRRTWSLFEKCGPKAKQFQPRSDGDPKRDGN